MLSRQCIYACHALVLVALLGFSAGCGPDQKARANVKGKVTVGGKALTTGSVMFYGKNNLTASATIDTEGHYDMKDAPIGDVTITVTVPQPPPGGLAKMKAGPGVKAAKDGKSVDPEGSGRSIPMMGMMPNNIVSIPEKYSNADTSGLTYKVEKGEHTHDITLAP